MQLVLRPALLPSRVQNGLRETDSLNLSRRD